jgi:hypothetical protein
MKIKVPIGRAKLSKPLQVLQVATDDFTAFIVGDIIYDSDPVTNTLLGTITMIDLYGINFTFATNKLKMSIPYCATEATKGSKTWYICHKPVMQLNDMGKLVPKLTYLQSSKKGKAEDMIEYYPTYSY